MMQIQPKPYLEKIKLRHNSYGIERRRNMSKIILEHGTPFPKPIEYADIDNAMFEWVDKKLNIVYDGIKLPTYKMFTIQRINEYMQEWRELDDAGNPILNFKILTREPNPQHGNSQGAYYNIPGHPNFAMFYVPVLQENGTEAYDKYTMKQPFSVDFIYTVSIVTNKMDIVNKMNELVLYEFNAINTYIAPNGHPMSMTLDSVTDNSEYDIEDRKFYLQTYKINVRGYIIRKEDYEIKRIPSRMLLPWRDSDAAGVVNRKGKNRRKDEKVQFLKYTTEENQAFKLKSINDDDRCIIPPILPVEPSSEIYEESENANDCCPQEEECYQNKIIKAIISFDCTLEESYVNDMLMKLTSIETENIYDFRIFVNDEQINLERDVFFYPNDKITVKISREDLHKPSTLTLVGLDKNEAINICENAEVSIDEPYKEEDIIIQNPNEDNAKN